MSVSDTEFKQWLERPGELRCALFELTFAGNNGGALGEFHVHVANMPFVTGASDAPANTIFEECVLDIPSFSSHMGEQLTGRTTQSYGDLIVANNRVADANGATTGVGERDSWKRMNWDGRRIREWLGSPAWSFADFRVVLDGVIADVYDAGGNKLGFKIADKEALLGRPVMTTLLGGNGPQAGDLMPMFYGYENPNIPPNVTPKLTDSVNHVYKFTGVTAGGLIESINTGNPFDVRENGASLAVRTTLASANPATNLLHSVAHGFVANIRIQLSTLIGSTAPAPLVFGTDYWVIASGLTADDFKVSATLGGAEIDITSAGSGTSRLDGFGWTTSVATGSFQLVGNPAGLITCDPQGVKVGSTPTQVLTAGGIANLILTSSLTNTPLTSADIDASSVAAFIALCTSRLALYLTDTISFSDLLDKLVTSVGGWRAFSMAGLMQFGRLDLPVPGTPAYSFIAADVALRTMKIDRRILPRAQIKLTGATNYTVQNSVAGSVNEWNRNLFASENATVTNSATVTTWDTNPLNHKSAVYPDALPTLLTDATEMHGEAGRLATMLQYPTGIFTFQTHQVVFLLKMGDLIYMEHPDYTGYGICVGFEKKIKGRSSIWFFCQLPDVYPTADIA